MATVIMRIMRRSGPGLIWTPCILLMTPIENPLHSFSTFHYFLFKCIRVPGMCPEARWIDYPALRSPAADNFVGPNGRTNQTLLATGLLWGRAYIYQSSNATRAYAISSLAQLIALSRPFRPLKRKQELNGLCHMQRH